MLYLANLHRALTSLLTTTLAASLINQMLARGHQGGRTRHSQDIPDSGVDCDISSVELAKGGGGGVGEAGPRGGAATATSSTLSLASSASTSCSFVPLELLVTGGKITASIFDRGVLEDGQRMSVKVGDVHVTFFK